MKIPRGLRPGDRVGLIAPASPVGREDIERAKEAVEDLGLKLRLGESVYKSYGYLAGRDEERARDLNRMFEDESIDGIICLRGGYGSSRILDLIDYDMIRDNPKVFVGYSDITAIHLALNQKSRLVSYHGPMAASDLGRSPSDYTLENFKNMVFDLGYNTILKNPEGEEVITINEGIVEGELIGGNLSLLASSIGTDYELDTRDKIILIEEVGEDPYAIDRMLTQLRLSGKFDEARGLILGDFRDCRASKEEYDEQLPLLKVFEDILGDLDLPCIYNLKLGHCEPVLTIPFGIELRLNANKGYVELLEKPNL